MPPFPSWAFVGGSMTTDPRSLRDHAVLSAFGASSRKAESEQPVTEAVREAKPRASRSSTGQAFVGVQLAMARRSLDRVTNRAAVLIRALDCDIAYAHVVRRASEDLEKASARLTATPKSSKSADTPTGGAGGPR